MSVETRWTSYYLWCKKKLNIIVSLLASIITILYGATKKDRAYLHTQPIVNAIMMDVFDATPCTSSVFLSEKIPNSCHKKVTASESVCSTDRKEKANRTDVATPKANGAWLVEAAETRRAVSAVGPSLMKHIC